MLEAYEVFDASNEELISELQSLQQLLRLPAGPHHVEYKMLYDTVRQELEERGVSHKVFQQLAPGAPPMGGGLGLGLPSPGPFPMAAAFPPAFAVQQPMAALYSFGSLGFGGGGGGASGSGVTGGSGGAVPAAALATPNAVSYGYGINQLLFTHQLGAQSANGMAQSVNAMVAATVRHQPCQSTVTAPSASSNITAGTGASTLVRPQQAFQPPSGLLSAAPALPPAPAAAAAAATASAATSVPTAANVHSLLRNYDLAPPTAATKPPPPQLLASAPPPRPPPPPALTLQPQSKAQPQPPNPPQLQIQLQSPGPTPTGAATSVFTPGPVPGSNREKARSSSGDGAGGRGGGGGASGSAVGSDSDGGGLAAPAGAAAAGEAPSSVAPGGEASTTSVAGSNADGAEGAAGGGGKGGGSKQLTPWEAAMLAFQEEQRLLRKARKAIRKGPPPKPGAKKPGAVSPSHASGTAHHAPLGTEASSGSTRAGVAKLPRPSASGGAAATATTPGAARSAAGAAPSSPHGAVALAAGAAAAARGAATAANCGGTAGGKAGLPGNGHAAGTARGLVSGGAGGKVAGAGASAVPAEAEAASAAAPTTASAVAATAVPSETSAAVPAASADADAVPEEQGLAARTQAVTPEPLLAQLREPSEPESVKTDEESSDVVAAAMREAAVAAAAAAARRGSDGNGSSSESDPESVSSSGSGCHECLEEQKGQKQQQEQGLWGGLQGAGVTVRAQAGVRSAPPPGPLPPAVAAGVVGHESPAGLQVRAMSASHAPAAAAHQQQQQAVAAAVRPGQPTLVSSTLKAPLTAGTPRRSAWDTGGGGGAAVAAAEAEAGPALLQQRSPRGPEAEPVPSESGSESGADSAGGSASEVGVAMVGGRGRLASRSHPMLVGNERGRGLPAAVAAAAEEDSEEARQRAIAAAAAAAIQGRSAADASAYLGSANPLARAVIGDGPMKVDRWSDWDLADSSDALSAWATHQDADPVRGSHLRAPRPVGHLAPPESLVSGPPGAHATQPPPAASATSQRGPPGTEGAAGGGGSRHGSRPGEVSRTGSAPHGGGRRGAPAAADSGSGSGPQSDDDGRDVGGGGATRRGGVSAASATPPPLPRSGVVPAGTKTSTAAAATAAGGTGAAATIPGRRPPPAPGSSTPPQSACRTGGSPCSIAAALTLPRGGGSSCGNLDAAVTSVSPPASSSSETTAAATATAPYLQFYGAFHEILTLCYSSLPVMLDAAALASASVATVAGGGGGGSSSGSSSRPPSRSLLGSAAAAAAAGLDLMERYTNLLARCEAWQAKLRQLTSADIPEDAPPPPPPQAAATAPGPAGCDGSTSQVQALAPQEPLPLPTPQSRRFVAVADDTAHPEVRNVVVAALRLLTPDWALDPADQVTELAKPDPSVDDDAGGGGSNSSGGAANGSSSSRPTTALPPAAIRAGTPPLGCGAAGGGSPGGAANVGGGGAATAAASGGGGVARCHVWNVLWSWSVKARVPVSELLVWQRVNHFAEARQLTRKDLLKKHLAKYQAMHNTGRSAALFDRLTPTTFVLPKEAAAFEEAFVRALHGVEPTCVQPVGLNLWIQKPVGLSRGRGISLLTSLKQLNTGEPMVVQRYLTDPLLVEGHKFDLRLYVLVTSFNPLEAWMYDEGFARFTTLPYTLDESELGSMHVHLTNSSVQRTRAEAGQLPAFLQSAEPAGGSKTSLATLRRLLSGHGADWPLLWSRVCEVATAALFAAQDAIPHSPNSFELFGFDMMIDAELKVWLLEVNSSPSMGLDTPLDRAIKPRLVADVLELLAPLPFDRAALAGVLRARTNTSRGGRRGASGLLSGTASEERELCCADLQAVLGGALPRRYGERPPSAGGFTTCLAPSPFHDRLLKLRRPLP